MGHSHRLCRQGGLVLNVFPDTMDMHDISLGHGLHYGVMKIGMAHERPRGRSDENDLYPHFAQPYCCQHFFFGAPDGDDRYIFSRPDLRFAESDQRRGRPASSGVNP